MRYSLKDLSQPESEPVTLAEAKAHLRVTADDENSFIESLISSAREYCEGFTNRSLAQRAWRVRLDEFPCSADVVIQIPRPPLVSVESITYIDTAGNEVDLGSTDFSFDGDSEPGAISLPYGDSWPSTQVIRNAVTINFTAGYAPDACPARAKQAMLMIVGHWFNNREDVITGTISKQIELASDALLWQLKFDL